MQNILIIEDEVDIAELIAINLHREGFSVETIHDGREGLALVLKNQPDLVVLDLMIPTMDGYQVLKEMQRDTRSHSIPVLMLTARSQIEDRILGLEKGADDYMTKPFSPRELVLRVKAILKRRQSTPSTTVFSHGPFVFDKNNLAFYLEEEPVNLTATEFKLLLYLCQRSGQTQDRNELLRAVWGYSDDAHSRTLDTHMKRLRQKLGESGSLIETVRGVGYLVPDI
ncbi:response regulator transcription factor [Akkermansiaceae bacterium]|nr:response regulator transcription factor [bacterium]MDA8968971.1 response regulator transcription factor [Akkermansiaceae bacterium]MDB4271814.1 response regulator transcription factor [Akkermansiaceae bacterium]MDB4283080.1 response regulator transcription factor [Akkermansiaceae bacterium]MDB4615538.1 response regulator transcription factor [Akkermansiaceae bacterium]